MKISTKGRYTMRAMLDLAVHYGEGPILLKDIAERQQISAGYLEHLILRLKAAGLVGSTRGAGGGFTLVKIPSQIRLIDVIAVSEGSIAPAECVLSPETCSRSPSCIARDVWLELKNAMDRVLESMTLEDLVERQRGKEQPGVTMYHI